MSSTYTIILHDEFDWGYANINKKEAVKFYKKEFKKLTGCSCTIEAKWYCHLVFELGKRYPNEEILSIFKTYSDGGLWYEDISSYNKHKF